MSDNARIIAQGSCENAPGTRWRIVVAEKPDEHGVLRGVGIVEMTDHGAVDALGVQRWQALNGKSALSQWVLFAEALVKRLIAEQETE